GETALALLALRHSGVPAADPACKRAATRLARELPDGTVYGASLGILALLEQDAVAHRAEVDRLLKDLLRGQCRNGQWTYAYRNTASKRGGDNSNSQLAALALAVARAKRLAVPDDAFKRLDAFLLGSQNEDGGFGYSDKQRSASYGSMTAGGAMMLALCGDRERAELRRALAWLGRDLDPAKNRGASNAFGKKGRRGDNFWKHYWLWSLERACAAAGVKDVGGADWYALGAEHLLGKQREDGAWRDPEQPLQATCFALLFLRRATARSLTPTPAPTTPGGS
ncbi:MAG TPA: prenyltransferase/squalene oxidase repeat-containing protein, partial [Planctomycetota bacterium]|nr:prenyltransferase/squalene oxidase repeat-containing protein [Planctomycetota bacterium]